MLWEGDGLGMEKGLFLAACHSETFQPEGEQRHPPGSLAFYGSILAALQKQPRKWTGGQAGFVTY